MLLDYEAFDTRFTEESLVIQTIWEKEEPEVLTPGPSCRKDQTMSLVMIPDVRLVVNEQRPGINGVKLEARRACTACGGDMIFVFIGIEDAKSLEEFATEPHKICGICEGQIAEDLAEMELVA